PDGSRRMHDPDTFADGRRRLAKQLVERRSLGTDRVAHDVFVAPAKLDGGAGEIVDVDRLQCVPPVPWDEEEGEPADGPGDVVDQDIGVTKEHGGPQDRVAESRRAD